jgi:hypothetical protein
LGWWSKDATLFCLGLAGVRCKMVAPIFRPRLVVELAIADVEIPPFAMHDQSRKPLHMGEPQRQGTRSVELKSRSNL